MNDKTNANHSIKCSVESCAHHCMGADYCALSSINVGSTNTPVTDSQNTECASFKPGNGSSWG